MGITQKELARELGISYVTVNRALNGSEDVSEATRERIARYARERAYVPHRASQVLVRNRTRHLALFSSASAAYFWDEVERGAASGAASIAPFDYEVRYHRVPDYDTAAYLAAVRAEIDTGLDGAAFVNQFTYDMRAVWALAEETGIPYVLFNIDAPDSKRLCYIGANYHTGGALAARLAGSALSLKPGARALVIGLVEKMGQFAPSPAVFAQRAEGFAACMAAFFPQVPVDRAAVDLNAPTPPAAQLAAILRARRGRVDAVYCAPAFNAEFVAALEAADLRGCVTLVHDVEASALRALESGLLTAVVYQDPRAQGELTVRTLERILESQSRAPLPDVDIPHTLLFRENAAIGRGPGAG